MDTQPHGELTVKTYRYSFRGGYYAVAFGPDGKKRGGSGVYFGVGGKQKAINSALCEARTGKPSPDDVGCPG